MKQGGAGSGRHSVGAAVDKYNAERKKKLEQHTVKQSARGKLHFMGRLRESADGNGKSGKRFRVTLLQEGLGNFGDAFYYTAAAIQSAVPIFEGKKFMVDHPAQSEEQDRPERSVRDVSGYFENLSAEDVDGRLELVGDLVVAGDPADPKDPFARERALMRESLEYQAKHPDDALVGLSINAGGKFQTLPIEQFLESVEIPDACRPKLAEAVKQGVREIRSVSEMQSAVSCDLVTTAGAGGSVNQLLEGGKSIMGLKAKQAKQTEAEEKEKHESEAQEAEETEGTDVADGSDDAGDGDDSEHEPADGQTGEHPDAKQDEELIKSMLTKYLGEPDHSDEDKQMAHEAYQAAMEAGLEGKEAEKAAGYHMKMCKQAKQKQMQAEKSAMEADADGKGLDVKAKAVGDAGSAKGAQKSKESARSGVQGGTDVVKLTAQVAALSAQLEAINLEKHMDKALRESKLPMSATKKFRECAKNVRSVKEFNEKLSVFKEAYSLRGEAQSEPSFILSAEKQGDFQESASGFDFSDCSAE